MSQVDQKRAYNKLKHSLEPFRTAVLQANAVLTWQKNYYPGVVFGSVSLIFLTLWALDLSIITLLSLGLISLIIGENVFPIVLRLISNSDKWNGDQEAQFEEICTTLCNIKYTIIGWYEFLFKEPKSSVFTVVFITVLLGLAWLGATINNLLLLYAFTLIIVMWPGIQDKHIFKVVTEFSTGLIQTKIKSVKKDE